MNIYVSNLSFKIQDEDLRNFFAPFGEVASAQIINDRETGNSRGFGFVEMSDETAAKKAIGKLNGFMVEGRAMNVSEAKPKAGGKPVRRNSPFRSDNNGGDNFNNANSYNENRY